MNKYLQSILVFDVALPALLLGLPGFALLWAVTSFQGFANAKTAEFHEHADRVQQVALLNQELQPVQAKVPLLKAVLSNADIEARLDRSISAALGKFSPDEIERTLGEFQFGLSTIGQSYGEGHRLSLKFSSRWEPLNAAVLEWETSFPNLLLESLSIQRAASSTLFAPYIESALTYYVITDN
jgi:hypothetical protein